MMDPNEELIFQKDLQNEKNLMVIQNLREQLGSLELRNGEQRA